MATIGEVRKSWAVAKSAVGGMAAIRSAGGVGRGVRILPDVIEVWAGGECVRLTLPLGVGPVAVAADTFAALVKIGKPSDEVAVELDGEGFRWNGADVPTIDGDDFPGSPVGPDEWYGPYPGESVKGAAGFAARGDMRPVLNTVAFRNDEVVATDSYRLSRERIVGGRMPGDDPVLIPAKPVAAIGAKSERVMVGADDRGACILGDIPVGRNRPTVGVAWYGSPVQGQYPKYENILPDADAYGVEACLYPERGIAAVESAVAATVKNRPAKLTLNGEVEVSAESPEGIALPPTVMAGPARWSDGPPVEPMAVGVNPAYLRDAVKYLDNDGGGVFLRVISPLRPMLLERPARNGLGERSVLQMPIKLCD